MNILFTLCGRAGSKGFKNKNLKMFLDIPLVYYSLAAMKLYEERHGENSSFDIVLNTDSEDLISLASVQQKALDVHVIRREESLSGDRVPKAAVIKNCLDLMEKKTGKAFDVVVDLDITSPLRTVEDIWNAVSVKANRPDVDVVYSVTESRRNPFFNMVKQEGEYFSKAIPSDFTARQQAPVFYDMNASIYAYSPAALREKDTSVFFNDRCFATVMKDTGILDIDSEEDFELMQAIAGYFYGKYPEYGEIQEMAKTLMSDAE